MGAPKRTAQQPLQSGARPIPLALALDFVGMSELKQQPAAVAELQFTMQSWYSTTYKVAKRVDPSPCVWCSAVMIRKAARLYRKMDCLLKATMLNRSAELYCHPPRAPIEEMIKRQWIATKLLSWVFPPQRDSLVSKAGWLNIAARCGLGLDSIERLSRDLRRPGRPPSTRRFAVDALELHRRGLSWREIEGRLPTNWRNYARPGQSIRAVVQLLKRDLRDAGIPTEGV